MLSCGGGGGGDRPASVELADAEGGSDEPFDEDADGVDEPGSHRR
jgi:hypothetical protein